MTDAPHESPVAPIRVALVDDQALVRTGFRLVLDAEPGIEVVGEAADGRAALELVATTGVDVLLMDVRMPGMDGIAATAEVSARHPRTRIIVLTGYGNIATAVSAVKLGAVDYLAKPADADDVTDALLAPHNAKAAPPENPMSADRVRWEHIQRVYELCNRNVSETARRLNMHRRTLQRILAKRAPK